MPTPTDEEVRQQALKIAEAEEAEGLREFDALLSGPVPAGMSRGAILKQVVKALAKVGAQYVIEGFDTYETWVQRAGPEMRKKIEAAIAKFDGGAPERGEGPKGPHPRRRCQGSSLGSAGSAGRRGKLCSVPRR